MVNRPDEQEVLEDAVKRLHCTPEWMAMGENLIHLPEVPWDEKVKLGIFGHGPHADSAFLLRHDAMMRDFGLI
jgi:hypothetical protein